MPSIVWIWLAAFVVFLIIEILTPSMFFIGFAISALIAGIIGFFAPEAYYWQIGVFIFASIIILPFTRRLANRITKESPQQSNVDLMIGKTAIVTQAIDPDSGGMVKFEGETWRATADEAIDVHQKVIINSVSGTKVHVSKA